MDSIVHIDIWSSYTGNICSRFPWIPRANASENQEEFKEMFLEYWKDYTDILFII